MVAGWLLVAIVLVGIVILFKVAGNLGKGVGIAVGLLILFLAITIGIFAVQPGVGPVDGFGDFIDHSRIYLLWVGGIFSNLGEITGYAVGLNWTDNLPDEPQDDMEEESDSIFRLN